jgi:4-amino-4-deoxy-L-arabinose transferase-like glycosyltransferase
MQQWGAVLPQWLGMVGLVFCAVYWAVTPEHIISGLLVSAFIGLIGVGQGAEALSSIKRETVAPAPAEDEA